MNKDTPKLSKKEVKDATKIIDEIFNKLGIDAETEVVVVDDSLDVKLKTDESGILIGYHGETLEGLQLVISLAVSKKIGHFVRVLVDVGDYRKQRTEYLEQLAAQMKDSVLREQRERVVTSLKSWERRIIHMLLKDDQEVVTESQGTGRDRVLVIKPR